MLRSCYTCRQRRRGCDKSKPTCRTCYRDGLECEGYAEVKNAVFVHTDVKNIDASKKKLLRQAVKEANWSVVKKPRAASPFGQQFHLIAPSQVLRYEVYRNCIRCLDLTWVDFRDHLSQLWNHFQLGHTRTKDGWAPSFAPLISQNRYLDLALIALSGIRFSQATRDVTLRAMSLTAYGQSLGIFRHVCVKGSTNPRVLARLAATALVYTMFEAMHHTPATIFTSGLLFNNAHLTGAMIFIRRCGPQGFSDGGDHLVFKKLREMVILDSFLAYKRSFFADPCWLTEPWLAHPKTNRDRLFDIVAETSELLPFLLSPKSPLLSEVNDDTADTTRAEDIERLQEQYRIFAERFAAWEQAWHSSLPKVSLDFLLSLQQDPRTTEVENSMVELLYLQLELWSFLLVLALCSMRLLKLTGNANKESQARLKYLFKSVKRTLELPNFMQRDPQDQGIVEGHCRSLFAGWALLEYQRYICEPRTQLTRT